MNDKIPGRLYSLEQPPSLESLKTLCSQTHSIHNYPHATHFTSNIPIYKASFINTIIEDKCSALKIQEEWYRALLSGPGVFVVKGLYPDKNLIETVNRVFEEIIQKEKKESVAKGDHFAAGGKNDRIWNSFSKHCVVDSSSFLKYYSNPLLASICEAWLGPSYRITAQVNNVNPGGAPQEPHRDYHLGFQTAEACSNVPIGMQHASQFLTLQGAVAHSDMPLRSGPTRLLPFSQSFPEGFMAWRLPEFKEYFLENYVGVPLEQGDGLFFNPALFHAAGENQTTDIERKANLLQISSAFGKPMESIDTLPLVKMCWMELSENYVKFGKTAEVKASVAAIAEGYPFPTNLDRRPPAFGGMAPMSEQHIVWKGLDERWDMDTIVEALESMRRDSKA